VPDREIVLLRGALCFVSLLNSNISKILIKEYNKPNFLSRQNKSDGLSGNERDVQVGEGGARIKKSKFCDFFWVWIGQRLG